MLHILSLWRSRRRIQRVTAVYGVHVSVLVCCWIMGLFLFDCSVLFERRENLFGSLHLGLSVPWQFLLFPFLQWTARSKSITTDEDKYILLMQQWQKRGNINVVVLNLDAFIWGFCRSSHPGVKCRYQAKLVPQLPQKTKRCCKHNTEDIIQAAASSEPLCLKVWSTQT